MKKPYTAIMSAVCAAAFLGGIAAGYVQNKSSRKKENIPIENVQAAVSEEESVFRETETAKVKTAEYYQVKSTDEYVFLYEVFDDDTKKEIQKIGIKDIFLPEDEKELIKNGIEFYEKEEALMAMESLVN